LNDPWNVATSPKDQEELLKERISELVTGVSRLSYCLNLHIVSPFALKMVNMGMFLSNALKLFGGKPA
jgi:hypothetical protein